MKAIVIAFLALPLLAFAQPSELDELKEVLETLKAANAAYETRIRDLEDRLIAIEQSRDSAIEEIERRQQLRENVVASQSSGVPDEVTRTREPREADRFSTGFGPNRFAYYGYLRAGYGVDEEGTAQEKFRAPGAGAAYRLGNETDTYVETGFSWYNLSEDRGQGEAIFGTHVMLAYATVDKNTGIDLDGSSGTISLREAYATARNVIRDQSEATFWAGQRYYRRHDIHINDFFWLDMSGYGGGLEDYDLGWSDLSVAWIGGTTDKFAGRNDYIGDLEDTDKNNFDLRLNNFDLGIGRGNLWLNYSHYRFSAENLELKDADGFSGGFWLVTDFDEFSRNTAVIQYGTSVAANFNSFSPSLREALSGEFPEGTIVEDQSRVRLMDIFDYRFSDHWAMQAIAIYQDDDLGLEDNTEMTWYSVGMRPIYSFNHLYNVAFEAGYDYTKLENGDEGGLLKLSVASEITPDLGYFSRPVIRFYLTWAKWSDEFRGLIAGKTYAEDTSGTAVGVQVESWW